MSDIKRFNTEEEMLNYAKEKGNFDKEKNSYTIEERHAQFGFKLPAGFFELNVASNQKGLFVYSGFDKKLLEELDPCGVLDEEELDTIFQPIRDAAERAAITLQKKLETNLTNKLASILEGSSTDFIKKIFEEFEKHQSN